MRLAAVATSSALLFAACTDGQEPTEPTPSATAAPSPTVESTPSVEPSPSPSDPFAMPDEITADYVERVLNEINRLDAELTKDILRRPIDEDAVELPAEDQEQLALIYADPLLTLNSRGKADLLRTEEQRENLVQPDRYGQLQMTVERLLATEPCIVALVDRDFSEVDAELDEDTTNLAFVYLNEASDQAPTNWRLVRVLVSDAAPESSEEQELRNLELGDLESEAPEVCG